MKPLFEHSDVINRKTLSKEGLVGFLASSYIKGIGKSYATKLVSMFGFDLLDAGFDFNLLKGAISGLGENKVNDLENSLKDLKYRPEIVVMLYSAGLSDTEVEKILSHYGRNAALAIGEDPYDMVENVWKLSFFTADKIGKWLGYDTDDPRRIRGALLTAVKFYAERGNMFATEDQALNTAAALAGVSSEKVKPELDYLIADERLIKSRGGIYLPVYYEAEKEAAAKIRRLIRRNKPLAEDYEVPLTDIDGNSLNKDQIRALKTVMENSVTVITGGPGTGKTTALRGIISMFEDMGKHVVLAAPTGRAAKRMSELSGAEAKTIHRLLGYSMGRGYRNKHFKADILVIDEASMLEQVLFRHLLDALEENTKVVLIGDTNQLPSIGAGNVLDDLIGSGVVPVVELKENFRQKKGSMIAATAEAIKAGNSPLATSESDFMLVEVKDSSELLETILATVADEIPAKYGVDPKDIQVVTPQQEGPLGARQLNLDIQARVNPYGPEIKRGSKTFRLGDRVMQISNSSEHDTYNGETGWVSDVFPESSALEVTFHDGKREIYPKERLRELSLAYATTVHKMQGSETDYMVMALTVEHRPMLYRNLLYTGISRAKKLCVLIGEKKALETAIANDSKAIRNSNFIYRLIS